MGRRWPSARRTPRRSGWSRWRWTRWTRTHPATSRCGRTGGGSASPPPEATATTSARASRWRSSTWSMRRRRGAPHPCGRRGARGAHHREQSVRPGRGGDAAVAAMSAGAPAATSRTDACPEHPTVIPRFGGAYRSRTIRLPNRHAITFPSNLRDCLLRASRESDFGTRRASVSAPERRLPVSGGPCRP